MLLQDKAVSLRRSLQSGLAPSSLCVVEGAAKTFELEI